MVSVPDRGSQHGGSVLTGRHDEQSENWCAPKKAVNLLIFSNLAFIAYTDPAQDL